MSRSATDLEALRAQINERIQALYPDGPENLLTPVAYVAAGQGKRLRPLLTLLSAKAFGGSVEAALPAAVAIEVLHNFTLVHDDIMDKDDLRHGQQSVHAKWDDNVAILTGDVLFVLALQELRRSAEHVDQMTGVFAAGALAVCEGQALDLAFALHGLAQATEKADYSVTMARRAKVATLRLQQIADAVSIPEISKILGIANQAELKLNNKAALTQAAENVQAAAKQFAQSHDGSTLEAVDALIPTSDQFRGSPSS